MTEHHWLGHRDGGRADAPAAEAVAELAAQHSQTATLIGAMGRERYAEWVEDEAFVERVRPAVPNRPCPSCWWDLRTARWRCSTAGHGTGQRSSGMGASVLGHG